jgi:stage V sporulation protein G
MTTGFEITDCRVRPCAQADDKLRAFATITLNDAFVVCDLKVINGNEGIFVAMPSRRRRDGSFRDIAHPLNAETREYIERVVLQEYARELERRGERLPAPPAHMALEEIQARGVSRLYRPAELAVLADMTAIAPNGAAPRPEVVLPCEDVEDELDAPPASQAIRPGPRIVETVPIPAAPEPVPAAAAEEFEPDLIN